MTTASTNVVKVYSAVLFELACLFVSIGSLVAFSYLFLDEVHPADFSMVALYSLGLFAAWAVVKNPVTILGSIYAGIFKVVGGFTYVLGIFLIVPWLIGVAAILSNKGLDSEYAMIVIFWLPIYFGLPAMIGLSGRHQ